MGVSERRERERQELRSRIMDAARRLFAEEGYEAVSMRRIAEAIEYSPTAIYLHFADKQALFNEICAEDFGRLATVFGKLGTVSDPVQRIREIGRTYVRFALEYPNHYRLMFMTPSAPDEVPPEQMAKRGNPDEDAYAFLRTTVREGIESGRFRPELTDADLLTQSLWASVHGVASLQITHSTDVWVDWRPVEAIVDLTCTAGLRGMLRDPDSLPASTPLPKTKNAKAARAATSTPKRHCPVAKGAKHVAKVLASALSRKPGTGDAR